MIIPDDQGPFVSRATLPTIGESQEVTSSNEVQFCFVLFLFFVCLVFFFFFFFFFFFCNEVQLAFLNRLPDMYFLF